MKLVVTGSKGNVGRYVVDYATAQDAEVRAVDQVGRGTADGKYLSADLTDFGATVDALVGADAVIHLAAIPDSRLFSTSKTFGSNMTSVWNVFEACHILKIPRVVFASTIQVTRTARTDMDTRYQYLPVDEDHPTDPQSDYALSKQLGEHVAAMYSKHFGLTTVCLRFMWVTLPEDDNDIPIPAVQPGHLAMYAYCDARDTARACYLAATKALPANSHTVAFVTAKDSWINVPSADLAREHFAEAEIRGLQGYDSLISGKRAEQVLGFVPEFSCRDAK